MNVNDAFRLSIRLSYLVRYVQIDDLLSSVKSILFLVYQSTINSFDAISIFSDILWEGGAKERWWENEFSIPRVVYAVRIWTICINRSHVKRRQFFKNVSTAGQSDCSFYSMYISSTIHITCIIIHRYADMCA